MSASVSEPLLFYYKGPSSAPLPEVPSSLQPRKTKSAPVSKADYAAFYAAAIVHGLTLVANRVSARARTSSSQGAFTPTTTSRVESVRSRLLYQARDPASAGTEEKKE